MHVAQLAVDVLQDLGVGLVLGSVAAERALRESRGQRSPKPSPHPQTLPDFPKGAEESRWAERAAFFKTFQVNTFLENVGGKGRYCGTYLDLVQHGGVGTPVLAELDEVGSCPVVVHQ